MKIPALILLLLWACQTGTTAMAQEPRVTGDQDGSSQQVEESDEAYRRRMELEDARNRDPTYTDPAGTYSRELEKIDKLPPESRDNIRDQLVEVIMANPEWKPGDALEEYPYEPTEAAGADAELRKHEQAAWDEQIEKYHAREAQAFGAYRGPAGGPGNPQGGSSEQDGQAGGQGSDQESRQAGEQSSEGQNNSTAGTYQAQDSSEDEGPSTRGVSESALDFLRSRRPGPTPSQSQQTASAQSPPTPSLQAAEQAQTEQAQTEQAQTEQAEDPLQSDQSEPDMRGIIAIEDLDKLEGTGSGRIVEPPLEQQPDTPDERGRR